MVYMKEIGNIFMKMVNIIMDNGIRV
jgi:hypothetical protein